MIRACTLGMALTLFVLSACGDDDVINPVGSGGTSAGGAGGAGGGGEGGTDGSFSLTFEEITIADPPMFVTDYVFLPGGTQFLAAQKDGTVLHYELSGDEAVELGSFVVDGVYDVLDCGLLSLAVDPDFAQNGYIYYGTCIDQFSNGIYRLELDPGDYDQIPSTAVEIIVEGDENARVPWHNVGSIVFDEEGYLWALFGEKALKTPAQDNSNNLGTLLRINPSREPGQGGYEPHPDNPFVDVPGMSPDIYAYGLRSPWKGSLDDRGRFWVGDVGSSEFEEINLITEPGMNMGWPIAEGPCVENCEGLTDPITYWSRSSDHPYVGDDFDAIPSGARVAWVGPTYVDRGTDRYDGHLTGRVLFGEYCVGFVRAAEANDDGELVFDQHVGHLPLASGWQQAPDGHLYVFTFGQCQTDKEAPEDDFVSHFYRAVLAP